MLALKKYITAVLAVVFTATAIGTPVAVYRCVMCGQFKTVNCCAPVASRHQAPASVSAPVCNVLTHIGVPLQTKAVGNPHRTVITRSVVFVFLPSGVSTRNATPQFSYSPGLKDFLPNPLSNSACFAFKPRLSSPNNTSGIRHYIPCPESDLNKQFFHNNSHALRIRKGF